MEQRKMKMEWRVWRKGTVVFLRLRSLLALESCSVFFFDFVEFYLNFSVNGKWM